MPGFGVPSGLIVAWPPLHVPGLATAEFADAGERLRKALTPPAAEAEAYRIDIGTDAKTETLVVEYWFAVPDTDGLLLLSFPSALVGLEHALVTLYDAIASTVQWPGRAPAEFERE